jgi:hypothetical protein
MAHYKDVTRKSINAEWEDSFITCFYKEADKGAKIDWETATKLSRQGWAPKDAVAEYLKLKGEPK